MRLFFMILCIQKLYPPVTSLYIYIYICIYIYIIYAIYYIYIYIIYMQKYLKYKKMLERGIIFVCIKSLKNNRIFIS